MRKTLRVLALLSIVFICGCSRTFTIVKDDSPVNRQNIKILNFSCQSGRSYIYLTNNDTLKVEGLSLANDTLTYFFEYPENVKTLPVSGVKKIVTRDGVGSFILGMGMGAGSIILGMITYGIIADPSLPGGPTAGLPTTLIVGASIGFIAGIAGFTAGEIIGVDKTFIFEN
ncbi:MAG: hypothetical protein ACM3Q2_14855 [Syntrophothermus sp.]